LSPYSTLPDRTALDAWLAELGWGEHAHETLAGDVGHRRYRILRRGPEIDIGEGGDDVVVLAVYPAALREACRRFRVTSELLAGAGVRVPRVLAADYELGAMLVEFLGDQTLNDWAEGRSWDEITPRFEAALEAARRISGIDPEAVAPLSPPLDSALLSRELRLTEESFLAPSGLLEGDLGRRLEATLEALADAIASVPPKPCHRDFMVRNLTPGDPAGVAVLDHQDLRLGPPLYDLASLLNDSLFPPPEIENRMVAEWCGDEDRRLEYHRVAAQRTLKAVGSYAMATADGKDFHRHRLAPTFERALDHLSRVPEAAATADALGNRWRELGSGAMLTA